jgi:hypothetical protein
MFYINSYLHSYIKPIESDILDYLERGEKKSNNNKDIKGVLSTVFPSLLDLNYYDLYESEDKVENVIKNISNSKVVSKFSEMIKYYTNMIKNNFFIKNMKPEIEKDNALDYINRKEEYSKGDAKIIGYSKSKVEFLNTNGEKAILRIYHARYYVRE